MSQDRFLSASEFDRAEWEVLVQKITDGIESDIALKTTTYDDIELRPLYDASDLSNLSNSIEGAGEGEVEGKVEELNYSALFDSDWKIYQFHSFHSFQSENKSTNESKSKVDFAELKDFGAEGVWLKGIKDAKDIKKLIKQAGTDLFFDLFFDGIDSIEVADAFFKNQKNSTESFMKSSMKVFMNLDPIGILARSGRGELKMSDLSRYVEKAPESCIPIGVNTLIYSEAGATEAEQLSFALATGVQYLRELADSGMDIAVAANNIAFTFAVTPEMFKNIALLRAFRICWYKILEACGIEALEITRNTHINAVTSPSYFTSKDKWVNLLRTTTACFGASIGGADSITILPLDYSLKGNESLAQRLALNVSHILKRESHLSRVKDPAKGSFYLESLTSAIANAGWERFQEIEVYGSMMEFLRDGKVKEIVEQSWERQYADIESGEKIIVGVNKFEDETEKTDSVEPIAKKTKKTTAEDFIIEPLVPRRRSELLEKGGE